MRNDFGTRPYKSRFGGSQAIKKVDLLKERSRATKIKRRIYRYGIVRKTPARLKASRDESYSKFGSKAKNLVR